MASLNESLEKLMGVDGVQAAGLVDYSSGMLLGSAGGGIDMEVAAAGNTEVVRAKLKTASALGLNDRIEDILISLGKAYHIIRPVVAKDGLFFYVVADKAKANLAMVRRYVQEVEGDLAM